MIRRLALLLAALLPILTLSVVSPSAAITRTCDNPQFTTSDPNGMWNNRGYIVHNNMWNVDGYNVSETLRACSYRNWYVDATADNSSGDGAVKTYPNVHVDYHNWSTGAEPRLSTFSSIRSTFAARTPRVGIYNAAYDLWLNGVATAGSNEVMIWTDNYRQVPAGRLVAQGVTFSNRTWKVYATESNSIISFVPNQRLTQGTIRLKARLNWLVRRGMIPASSTLGQICFGFEIVSTGGDRRRFKVDDFSVTTTRN